MLQNEETLFSLFWDEAERETPYEGPEEFMEDLLRLVSMLCTAYGELNHNEDTPYAARGMVVTEAQFHTALLGRARRAAKPEPLPEAARAVALIRQRVEASERQGVPLPFPSFVRRFALTDWEAFCVLLAVSTDLDRRFERIFGYLQDDAQSARATLGLAADLYAFIGPVSSQEVYGLLDRQRVVNELFLMDWKNESDHSALARPLAVPKQLLYVLTGVQRPQMDDLAQAVRVVRGTNEPVLWNEEQITSGVQFIQYTFQNRAARGASVLYLFGGAGQGKSFALSQIAKRVQMTVLEVEARALAHLAREEQEMLLRRIVLQCLLDGMVPCLDRLALEDPAMVRLAENGVRFLRRYCPLIVLCADRPWGFERDLDVTHMALEFQMPDGTQRCRFWTHFSQAAGLALPPEEAAGLAGRYRLSPAAIQSLVDTLARNGALAEQEVSSQIAQALREHARSRLGQLARRLATPFTWEDLKVPEEAQRLLRSACTRIQCQYQVNEDWGFARRLPYGRGLSILLYGPPGTGKTMAAQVLSATVGIDLFRVDLSQIVDKYIGETEKNLGRLFDTAEDINCILFFDEADALFSRRTEVGDSKDKYANVETAYLLQRIEQFPGITILATNNVRNFDEAFRRRTTYFINIPMPDQQTRQRIWESVFPPEIPVDRGVQFDELAERFEFSGSSIKSVAVSAAYAAAAAGTPVTRRSIREALRIEYLKTGKLLGPTEYY